MLTRRHRFLILSLLCAVLGPGLLLGPGCATLTARSAAAEIRCVGPTAAELLADVVAALGGEGYTALLDTLAGSRGRDAVACAVAAAVNGPATIHSPDGGAAPASAPLLDPEQQLRGRRWLAQQGVVTR